LSNFSTLEKYDTEGMYKLYDRWPQIAKESYELKLDPVDFKEIDHIVFSGMGGSGALGDIFSAILSKTKFHVDVVKGYHLPNTINSNTLVVPISVSGNTVETLVVLDSAHNHGCNIIAFSSGGKMHDYCKKNNIEFRKITQYHSPRTSFTSFLYSMLKVLEYVVPIKKEEIIESITQLEKSAALISSSNIEKNNPSFNLAEWMTGIPMIYYPWGLQAAAIRFKNSLQENVKTHAITEDIIEACHNGIVSWEKPSNVKPIMIKGIDDYTKTKERWKIIKEYFETNGIDYKEVSSVKGSILSKLINLIYLLDYSTIYLAVKNGIDPSPIGSIDYVKKRM